MAAVTASARSWTIGDYLTHGFNPELGIGRVTSIDGRAVVVEFPHADAMCCVIHVEDMAEAFARVTLSDKPTHTTYNSGGHSVSMGALAAIVKEFLPQADIRFKEETGGRAISGNFMIDNRRLVEEFGLQLKPLRQRVKEVINDIRHGEGLPPVA